MRSDYVIGRRIVEVHQQLSRSASGKIFFHVDSFVLDNGAVIRFGTVDMEDEDPAIEARVSIVKKHRRKDPAAAGSQQVPEEGATGGR